MSLGGAATLRAAARLTRIGGLAALTLARASRPGQRGAAAGPLGAGTAILADASRKALAVHHLEVEATGPLPRGPALLVCNHLSYLDPVVMASQVDCVPISKSELAGWPIFGAVARRTGVLFVERDSAGSRLAVMRAAERVLGQGGLVLNFPEGTTSDGSTVLPFRKGMFGVARALGVAVVPVALRYQPAALAWLGEATFLPHYLRFAATPRSRVGLAFGEPLASRAFPNAAALAEAARERILSLLREDRSGWLRKAR